MPPLAALLASLAILLTGTVVGAALMHWSGPRCDDCHRPIRRQCRDCFDVEVGVHQAYEAFNQAATLTTATASPAVDTTAVAP